MNQLARFVGVANGVRAAVGKIGLGDPRHRVLPGHLRGRPLLGRHLGATWLFYRVTTGLAIRMHLTTDHALDAANLVLVHADDGVSGVRFAPRRRAVRLDLAANLIRFFIEDGVHPCLLLDEPERINL
jgi:hypothetical protein